MNTFIHVWSEFLFVPLLVIFNFFLQMNHFYYFTSLHGLQDVENHCPHLRDIELKTGRKIFPMYYSLYNRIREHEITKLKKYICIESRKNGHKNKHKKT